MSHPFDSPVLPTEEELEAFIGGRRRFPQAVEKVTHSIFPDGRRGGSGKYDAPLPSPEERRAIRERAGLTQQDVADELFVSRWTVTRWEKPAGYRGERRLAGREPVGELRKV